MVIQNETENLHLISAETLFDGRGQIVDNGGVIIKGRQILACGHKAELLRQYPGLIVIEKHYEKCTLLPGLIDAHTHLIMPGTGVQIMEFSQLPDEHLILIAANNALASLKAGVTTLVDLGSKGTLTFKLRDAIERKIVMGSRLILAGRAITISGGHGWIWGGEADGEDGVRRIVRDLCKQGADLIKVMVTGGGTPGTDGRKPAFTLKELSALADEAHARGRKVIGHVTAQKGVERALDAGLDMLAHCQFLTPDGSIAFDEVLAGRMVEKGTVVNPTLQVNRILRTAPRNGLSDERAAHLDNWVGHYPRFEENFLRMSQMGIPILCGSDAGWGWTKFGETYLELDAMVAAGMSTKDALVSATGGAANILGWSDRIGSLQPGRKADLLVVEGNPLQDILALKKVRQVWLEGNEVL